MIKDVEYPDYLDYSAVDIAGYFLKNFKCREMTYFKLNKLVYLSFGWSIPYLYAYLFKEPVIAGKRGPIIESVYKHFNVSGDKRFETIDLSKIKLEEFKDDFKPMEKKIFDNVYNEYGKLKDDELSKITHEEGTPWNQFYNEDNKSVIDKESIFYHYFQLNLEGIKYRLKHGI